MVIRPIEKIEQAFKVAHKNEKSKKSKFKPLKIASILTEVDKKARYMFVLGDFSNGLYNLI